MEPPVGLSMKVTLSPNRGQKQVVSESKLMAAKHPRRRALRQLWTGPEDSDGDAALRLATVCICPSPSETPPFYCSSPNTDFYPPPGKELETPRERERLLLLFKRTQLKNNLVSFQSDAAGNAGSGKEVMNNGGEPGLRGRGRLRQDLLLLHARRWEYIIHGLVSYPGLFVGGLRSK